MSNLTEFARDQSCCFRIPGVCVYDAERTSLCHIRYAGIAGVGQRPSDLSLAHGCSACHDVVDGRVEYHLERMPGSWEGIVLAALLRTLERVDKHFQVRKRT